MFSTPKGAATLLLVSVTGLVALKILVGFLTGSISVWAQAADSALDIVAVVITFITVGFSAKPADQGHPFGHGKLEDVAAGTQAVLLLLAAGSIIYSAIRRIILGTTVELAEAGAAVMLVSIIASIFLSRHLFKVARRTGSVALEANANNIRADVYSASGVLIGLMIVRFTGLNIVDPILAILVSLLILRATWQVGRTAVSGLVDVRLPRAEEEQIIASIAEHSNQLVGFHEIRTRRAGPQRYVDLHLVMPKGVTVQEAHNMTDHLEQDIKSRLPNVSVVIHVEPCDVECKECSVTPCDTRADVKIFPKKDST